MQGTLESISGKCGIKLTAREKEAFSKIWEDKAMKRSAIGGLYVEDSYIYYSCYEKDRGKRKYILRKCNRDGKHILTIRGFGHIRGIGRDDDGNFYVSDCFQWRILKFDKDWNLLRQNFTKTAATCIEPYGVLVTSQYVFVCAHTKKQIWILNHTLDVCYKISLPFSPTDITILDNKYFVTAEYAIIMISIDFKAGSFERTSMTMENINTDSELRGIICVENQHLYVTEKGAPGHLLCFQFDVDHGQLKCVAPYSVSEPPAAIAHHDGRVYYGRGNVNARFSIMEIIHSRDKTLKTDILFHI
jgi:hypothetical protein